MKRAAVQSTILILIGLSLHAQSQDAEKEQPTATDKIEVKELKAQPVVQIRFEAKRDEIGGKLGMAYGRILMHINKSGGKPTMMPLSRFYGEENGVIDMAAAIAVEQPVEGDGDIVSDELPGGKIATTWHVGHYDKLPETYARLTQWATENAHALTGHAWEIYWTDPAAEPDPRKWETQIFMPLAE